MCFSLILIATIGVLKKEEEAMKKFLTSAHLKWLAIITMLIDHIGAVLVLNYGYLKGASFEGGIFHPQGPYEIVYTICRSIGRLAFPLFAFMVVEACIHTRDIKKYLLRLFIFALISEIPFDLATSYKLADFSSQNVFFTLFLGGMAIYFLKLIDLGASGIGHWKKVIVRLLAIILMGLIAYGLKTDYDYYGVFFIAIIYLLKDSPNLQVLTIFAMGLNQFTACLSAIPVYFYNGKRGNHPNKYVFYLFYPVHLLVLYWILKQFIIGKI